MNWDYCTHVPLLYEATRITDGDVVEMGMGLCSTPLLHVLITHGPNPRNLYSLDDDANWVGIMRNRLREEGNGFHQFIHIADWQKNCEILAADPKPSVVFIDHGHVDDIPGAKKLRRQAIEQFQDAEILVVHDASNIFSEDTEFSDYCLKTFKHVIFDSHTQPWTLWLSKTRAPEYTMQAF